MMGQGGAHQARSEQQRVEHLVLGRSRPAPEKLTRPVGLSKGEWKVQRKRLLAEGATLEPGIEEAVQLRERWSHRQGTPETLEHAHATRQGALARLHQSGAITADHLASAEKIGEAVAMLAAGIGMKTCSLEARVDVTRMGDGTFYEALGRVRLEVTYSRWRDRVAQLGPIGASLDMIVSDVGFTVAARRYRMHNRRAKKLLIDALDLWPATIVAVCSEIDAAELARYQAGF